jgi:hypothetical protein
MLQPYYKHVRAHENTLITKFFGLHCVKITGAIQKKVRMLFLKFSVLRSKMTAELLVLCDSGPVCYNGESLLLSLLNPSALRLERIFAWSDDR